MDVTLVEDAQDDVDGHQRRQEKEHFVAERRLERERRTLEYRDDAARHADRGFGRLDRLDRAAERCARRQIERDDVGGELAEMIDLQWCGFGPDFNDRR